MEPSDVRVLLLTNRYRSLTYLRGFNFKLRENLKDLHGNRHKIIWVEVATSKGKI